MATNLQATVSPLVPKGTPSPLQLSSPSSIQTFKGFPPTIQTQLSTDLTNIAKTVNTLHQNQQQSPSVQQIMLSNSAGQTVCSLGAFQYQGVTFTNWLSELHCGSALNCVNPSDPNNAIFNANTDGSVSIGNAGWIDVHDPYSGNAAWIGTQYDSTIITNAVNNGSGAIRLIIPGHTLATGNSCNVRNMNLVNVPNAVGLWTVTVIDAQTVDLQGSIWSGPWQPITDPPNGITTYQPMIDRVLQIAGATNNGAGLIRIQTTIAHGYESGTAVNIPAPGPVGVPAAVGQWVISIPATLAVTGAVNNGSGLIRLTVPGGNFKTGDRVEALNVGGVPNADGRWIVTAISATVIDLQGSSFLGTYTSGGTATFTNPNIFDLVGSTFAGTYISGGTVLQYFAGMLAETMAIGPSFQNYKLRAFPSGDLRINNASITLTSTAGTITLNPNTTQITLTSNTTLAEIVLDGTVPSLTFYDQSGQADVTLEILTETALAVTSASVASPSVLTVPGNTYVNGDTVIIAGAVNNPVLNGYRIVENVNSGAGTFTLTNLQGNPINTSTPETGTVTSQRYYAGLLAQSLALGGSWAGYRLRFFADGTLKINNASIDSSTITNSTINVTSFTSTAGTAPNVLTLTITNGILTISGTGTEAGHGTITIDGLLTAGAVTVSGSGALTLGTGNFTGTHAQNVGTGDSPTFADVTLGVTDVSATLTSLQSQINALSSGKANHGSYSVIGGGGGTVTI